MLHILEIVRGYKEMKSVIYYKDKEVCKMWKMKD